MELTSEKFKRIAKKLAPNARGYAFQACPDQLVGTLADIGTPWLRRSAKAEPFSKRRVVLVMESPHKAEFENGTPVGPANGPTGVNIGALLNEVLKCVPSMSDDSQVVLMNAVQYQCSLGEATKAHRDLVFREAWRRGGEADFKERLCETYRQGDLVINACTRGNRKEYLRDLVKSAIEQVVGSHWRSAHPFAWTWPGRTKAFLVEGVREH